jgi:stalled ribosome alternative rescue factor ArfA
MKKMKKPKGLETRQVKNPVAKFAFKFNKARVFNDKTKYQRNNKHKGKEPFPMASFSSALLEKVSVLTTQSFG